MEDKEYWESKDFDKEARSLCSAWMSVPFNDRASADFEPLKKVYEKLEGSPYADRLSLAVANLLDDADSDDDMRTIAANFFANWPMAAGSERILDIIEKGPRHPVHGIAFSSGLTDISTLPIEKCFKKVLLKLAASGHLRAITLGARSDLEELFKHIHFPFL